MIVLVLLAACSDHSGHGEPPTPVPAAAGPLSATTEAWWAYERPAQYQVHEAEVDVPVRDGITLGCTLRRPADDAGPIEGRFPGLVTEFTPYVNLSPLYRTEAAFFTERGYATLVCTVRGTGRSQGEWGHANWDQDGRDAHDIVEWLAAQGFCNGRVGQFGESYGGQTSYGAATERPAHLVAIAPLQAPGSLYHDVVYPGGIKSTERGVIDNWPPIVQQLSNGAVDADAEYAANRAHADYDAYWMDRSLYHRYDDIQVPVLAVGGYPDMYFRDGTLANIEGALNNTWAVYGPWPHNFPVNFDAGTGAGNLLPTGILLAWFDHWLMELPDLPIPQTPNFVSFEGPREGGRGWRELAGWNPEGSDPLTMTLGAAGTLGEFVSVGVPAVFAEPSEPGDIDGSVSFTSEPLADDRVLLGRAMLELSITLSAADAHLYAELVDVDPNGAETLVNDGFLAVSHRNSHSAPSPAPVGEEVRVSLAMRPAHHRFLAGHSVRVRISGGGSNRLAPPPGPVEIQIATGASTIRLPGFATPLTE